MQYQPALQPRPKPVIYFIIINEHTLAYQQEGSDLAGILHTSILRGSRYDKWGGAITIDPSMTIRAASKRDFIDYRHSYKGYGNCPVYDYRFGASL